MPDSETENWNNTFTFSQYLSFSQREKDFKSKKQWVVGDKDGKVLP